MPGIILEGGTFRPIFSAGVMDALFFLYIQTKGKKFKDPDEPQE